MAKIKINVTEHLLTVTELPMISAYSVNIDEIEAEFDETWNGFAKIAILKKSTWKTTAFTVFDCNNIAKIPDSVDSGNITLGIVGINSDSQITTNIKTISIEDSAEFDGIEAPEEDVYRQILDSYARVINQRSEIDAEIHRVEAQANANYETVNERVNNLVATDPGSTGDNAELLDIRVGYDGKTYPTAGEAVRGQTSKLSESVTEYIVDEKKAIVTGVDGEFITDGEDVYAKNTNAPYYFGKTEYFDLYFNVSLTSTSNQAWVGVVTDDNLFIGCNLLSPSIKKIENGSVSTYAPSEKDVLLPFTSISSNNKGHVVFESNTMTITINGTIFEKYSLNYENVIGIGFLNLNMVKGRFSFIKHIDEKLNDKIKEINAKIDEVSDARFEDARFEDVTWNVLGDSFTARNKYQYMVQEVLGIGTVNSYGISGSCIADSSPSHNPMCVRYLNMKNDANLITVWGGVNDYGKSWGSMGGIEIGTFGDTQSTTFYGALKILLEGLLTKYPKAKIGFIIPPFVNDSDTSLTYKGGLQPNSLGYYLEDYRKAIRQMCSLYSIPFLDLGFIGGLNQFNINVFSEDGLHPNTEGFEFLKYKISNFIKNL